MADQHQAGELAQQIAQKTAVSPTTSATPAGQVNADKSEDVSLDSGLVESINQVFALFRLNYHNQYYAAWSDAQQLGQVKRLWSEALGHFSSDLILMGARRAIEASDYLPTLNRMLASCSEALGELGLPTANAAYEEACLAPSPKAEAAWTHPIAYLAGRDAGWYLLANHTRGEAWPSFQVHYNKWLRRALAGDVLTVAERKTIDAPRKEDTMSNEQRKEALCALKEQLGL